MAIFRPAPPHNYKKAKTVEQELSWTLAKANTQYIEAISVDGVEINYWKKCEEGQFCTCRYGLNHKDNTNSQPSQQVFPPNQSNVSPPLDNTSDSFFQARGAWDDNLSDTQMPSEYNILGAKVVNIAPGGEGGDNTKQIDNRNTDLQSNQETDETEAFLAAPANSDLLFGEEKNPCGICLGTGKTNAWNLLSGKREIFNTFNVNDMKGFRVNTNTRPYSFSSAVDEQSYVEFICTMPTYYKSCLNYTVRNNTKSVRNLKIFYKIAGTNDDFQRLTLDFLNSRQGTPTQLILRVQPIVNSLEGTLSFTHIELIWQYADFPKVQVGPLTIASNPQINDRQVNTSFTFPPSIDNISVDDVFYELKYRRIWKVSDVTDFQTSQNQVLGWTVSARNLMAWEMQSLLKISHERYYELSYSGLQLFQDRLLNGSGLLPAV